MHPDDIGPQIADLVDANADQSTPPPVAAIRRRGRLRRTRLTSGVVLVSALVAGLLAFHWPLGETVAPTPATQPPRPTARPARPAPTSFADHALHVLDSVGVGQIVLLDQGENATWRWQIGAASAFHAGRPQVCLLYQTAPSTQAQSAYKSRLKSSGGSTVVSIPEGNEGHGCRDQDAGSAALAPDYVDGDNGTQPAFGTVPEGTARVRLLLEGRPPLVVDAIDGGPGFKLRFYVVARTDARIVGVVALDAGNRELARYP